MYKDLVCKKACHAVFVLIIDHFAPFAEPSTELCLGGVEPLFIHVKGNM